MSDPIRIDITTVNEILGDKYGVIDLNRDRVLSAGDIEVNPHDSLENITPEVVAQHDTDAFFSIETPDQLLSLLEKGGRRVRIVTGETGGRVFLVTSQHNDTARLGSIYEIGDYTKITGEYEDYEQDSKVDLNVAEARAASSLEFDYDRLERACVSKRDPGLIRRECLDNLKDYETDAEDLQLHARTLEEAYTRLTHAYEENTLTRHEIEDFRQELKMLRDSLDIYQKTRGAFEQKYQKGIVHKTAKKKTPKQSP